MDEDFKEWLAYVDTFKNADGAIDLSAHPDFFEKVIPDIIGLPKRGYEDLPDNLGLTVNYELKQSL